MAHETPYGTQPFETVTRAEFTLIGLQSLKQVAYFQYKLTLLKPVLRVSVNFAKKSMVVDYIEPEKTARLIEQAMRPVKVVLKSKTSVPYDELVRVGFHG